VVSLPEDISVLARECWFYAHLTFLVLAHGKIAGRGSEAAAGHYSSFKWDNKKYSRSESGAMWRDPRHAKNELDRRNQGVRGHQFTSECRYAANQPARHFRFAPCRPVHQQVEDDSGQLRIRDGATMEPDSVDERFVTYQHPKGG